VLALCDCPSFFFIALKGTWVVLNVVSLFFFQVHPYSGFVIVAIGDFNDLLFNGWPCLLCECMINFWRNFDNVKEFMGMFCNDAFV